MRRRRITLAVAALGFTATASGAQDSARTPVRARTAYEDLQLFGQVLNQIRVNHPDSLDTHALLMAAIEGMVHAADPHSFVVPAMRLVPEKEKQLRDGKLVPTPVDFIFVGGAPVVASVAAGTAASRLDLLPGDELLTVDGQRVAATSAAELDVVLAGPKGSEVALGLERRRQDGSLARLERRVRRERGGEASAVPVATLLDSAAGTITGYVRVTTFVGERVADELHGALERLEKQGMSRLVLDLRDNGGGSIAEAARVAGAFLPRGALVYTAAGRKAELTDTGRVSRSFWSSARRYPMVVLINGGTASASELVAGALQDHDRALIVGRPSFGKALMMRGFPLSDGSMIMLTVGQVKTPCGRVVQREYRSVTRRDYYRLAGEERDTAGRPSCRTDAGRTVYGGGGIVPDVAVRVSDEAPAWIARLVEQAVPLAWVGGYVDAHAAALTSLDAFVRAPALPDAALADFRAFAARQGVAVPTGGDADGRLRRLLVPAVAAAKWGEVGWYRADAALDPQVRGAVQAFGEAAALRR